MREVRLGSSPRPHVLESLQSELDLRSVDSKPFILFGVGSIRDTQASEEGERPDVGANLRQTLHSMAMEPRFPHLELPGSYVPPPELSQHLC